MSMINGRNCRSVASIGRRLLSTTSGTGGEANDPMLKFMTNLAEKRKSEGPDTPTSLWEKLGKAAAATTQSSVLPTRTYNYPNQNRNAGRGSGNSFSGAGRGGNFSGNRSHNDRDFGNRGGSSGGRGGFSGGRGGGRGGGMVGGRGYNNRTRAAPSDRSSNFRNNVDREVGRRGGRGGERGSAGRGGGNARRGSGGMRTYGGAEDDDDEREERGRKVKSRGGDVWEDDEDEDFDGSYYDEDGVFHGKNGETEPTEQGEGEDDEMQTSEADSEELFGVPDPIDGIIYFAEGSLPEHKNEKMDEVDRSNLFDSEAFADELGGVMDEAYIDTRGFDALDTMLANTFLEAYKSPDDTVMEAVEMPRRKHVQLPTPRSLVQLYNYTQPPVLQNSKPDDAGVALAQQAWGVIHQNFYYSDSEKYQMVEGIATLHRKLLREIAKEQSKAEGVDLIFQTQFRKGAMYEAEEERLKALSNIAPKEDKLYQQAETDWSVQAVVDEDQL